MRRETFVSQKHFLWLWLCLAGLGAMTAVYAGDDPIGGRNGGTRLGIIYGAIASAGILFLMWYGIRKRYSYTRGGFTLKRWLGPHVWIGMSLAIVVPLHFGFELRGNLHAMPYVIMLLTILSGIWGAYAYVRFPREMQARREGVTLHSCAEQIDALAGEIAAIANSRSAAVADVGRRLTIAFRPALAHLLFGRRFAAFTKAELSALVATLPAAEQQHGIAIIGLAVRRVELANQMVAEASAAAQMRVWLYVHVPLSFGCVVAVAAHVFWVFYYR